jgi:hypothetical protein
VTRSLPLSVLTSFRHCSVLFKGTFDLALPAELRRDSHYVNHELANRKLLDWQRGYGVVSFGTKDLQWVIDYIRNQKELNRTRI